MKDSNLKPFKVTMEETTFYTFLVDAVDEEQAGNKARDLFDKGEDPASIDSVLDIHSIEAWKEPEEKGNNT